MSSNDKIQDLSIWGLKYSRFLAHDIDLAFLKKEQMSYSYIVIFSYQKFQLDGFRLIKIQPTPIIDLAPSLEAIFSGFRKTTRNEIRKTEKMPDLKFEISRRGLDDYFRFYKQIKIQDGARPDIKREFKNCLFANAYLDNQLIASMSFSDNGRCLRCKHVASLRKAMGSESKIAGYAGRRLIWEVLKYGKNNGYQKLDLGGVTPGDPSKAGIFAFKTSFGGTIEDSYIYAYETKLFRRLRGLVNYFNRNIY